VRQELVFRLAVTWPFVALGFAVLGLLPPRIVLDGAHEGDPGWVVDLGRAAGVRCGGAGMGYGVAMANALQ
jgi:hypothetical protein